MTQQLRTSATNPSPLRLTYQEFLNWDGESQHVEWVNGEVVVMEPVSAEHQLVSQFLLTVFIPFTQSHDLDRVLFDPFQMKTGPDLPGRAPDILFIAAENLGRLKTNYLEGPADLVVEIISPGSRAVDRNDKYAEYERGGVREYWLIDPIRKQADFYQLGSDNRYQKVSPSAEGVYHSMSLKGLWIEVDWLWTRPTIISVLKRWKLV